MKFVTFLSFFLSISYILLAQSNLPQKQDSLKNYYFHQAVEFVENDSVYLAVDAFNKVLENTDNEKDFAFYSYEIGNYFLKLGIYDLAGNYLYDALMYYENAGESKKYVLCLFSVAEFKQRIGDLEETLKLLNEAQKISKRINNDVFIGNSYNNIGAAYFDTGDYESALSYYHKALDYPLDSIYLVGTNLNIGSTYRFMGDYDNSLKYLYIAKGICDKNHKGSEKEAHVLMTIGVTYISKGEYDKGFGYLHEAEDVIADHKADNLLYILYYNIAFSYTKIFEYEKAMDYFMQYDSVKSVVLSDERLQNAKRFEIEYNVMKKEAEIEKQKLKLKNKNSILVIEMLIIIVLIAFLVFYYFQRNKVSKLYKKLVAQNIKKIEEDSLRSNTAQTKTDDKTEQYELLADKIVEIFKIEKVYKDNSLTTSLLADKLKTNKTYISKAINNKFGKNFNTFLNEFRINESIKMIMLEEYTKYTISYIASEVGFNSISVFNANFKKTTGVTPSVFIKSTKEIKEEEYKSLN